jgi:hypothetical protein
MFGGEVKDVASLDRTKDKADNSSVTVSTRPKTSGMYLCRLLTSFLKWGVGNGSFPDFFNY